MPTRFMTDPHEMPSMAGRFDVHAQTAGDNMSSTDSAVGGSWA
jgi:hypothetical protein